MLYFSVSWKLFKLKLCRVEIQYRVHANRWFSKACQTELEERQKINLSSLIAQLISDDRSQ